MEDGQILTPAQYANLQKLRGSVLFRTHKGRVIAQKWPKKRGPARSQAQQAWQDQFSLLAQLSKQPNPTQFDRATELAAGTGWYYRDVLEVAMSGKLYIEDAERRVTTPTAIGLGTSSTVVPANTETPLPIHSVLADNNAFFSAAQPTRWTCKTAGLYYVSGWLQWTSSATTGNTAIILKVNGTTYIAANHVPAHNLGGFNQMCSGLWYFHANDYVQCIATKSSANSQARIFAFSIVGITPEVII